METLAFPRFFRDKLSVTLEFCSSYVSLKFDYCLSVDVIHVELLTLKQAYLLGSFVFHIKDYDQTNCLSQSNSGYLGWKHISQTLLE